MTALLIFEGLAVVRIVVGSFYGLHRWGFLIAIMIVGSLFYLIRGRHLAAWSSQWPSSPSAPGPDGGGWTGTGSSCSSSSSSSCSSSGGGCGGGSGCGGCGGGGD